jgi:hypothetical protein
MSSLADDIRRLITQRLAHATDIDILQLASALCANEDQVTQPQAIKRPRFTKINDERLFVLDDSSSDWVAVYDSLHDLTWTRKTLDCGEVNHADAMRAAGAVKLLGASDWRAPTIQERLSIVDYARIDPALDTDYFDGSSVLECTGTIAAAPSEVAWFVASGAGGSSRYHQSRLGYVRAVRAGQQLGRVD